MATKKQGTVQEVYQLPSLGKLYGPDFPSEVSVRSMTTFEEKMRLGSQGFFRTMSNILDAVVSFPDNFKSTDLTVFDFYFLMYKMRAVSYGPTYKVSVRCPHCGKQVVCKVNLDDIVVDYLEDSSNEPITIGPLPRSGDKIDCRFLRVKDLIYNDKRSKEILRMYPDYEGDPLYILEKTSRVVALNGASINSGEAQMYVEQMPALDSAYFDQAYAKLTDKVGMHNDCHEECPECGEVIDFGLSFSSEFFRPTFDF